MTRHYRPHGPLRWLIDRIPAAEKWDLVGALAAEERSATVPQELSVLGKLGCCKLLRIHDESSIFADEVNLKLAEREAELQRTCGGTCTPLDARLMSDLPELEPLWERLEPGIAENAILDISCLPKRFFFYFLRRLISSSRVRQLLITVTIPGQYGGELSRNAGRWDYLPSFGRERSEEARPMLVIAVGYQHLNLLDVVDEGEPVSVRLLFPFPSKPPGGIRNWEFVRNIEQQKKFGLKPADIIRVHPQETPLAFEILLEQCASQPDEVWLAPFGPKSISLAMALFALACEAGPIPVSVGYNQPLAYSANYSTGVETTANGTPRVHAYCVKLNGANLYSV